MCFNFMMPPAMADSLDIWSVDSQIVSDGSIRVDFLLPTGIYIQLDVPREAPISYIKQMLWKQVCDYPMFNLLMEIDSYMFACVNQTAVYEELEDETRRLCDVRPFLPVLKLVTRSCDPGEKLDSKIGVLIGKVVGPPGCAMWDATSAWLDERCHVHTQDPNQRNPGLQKRSAHLTTWLQGRPI
uniref:Phosphatidylinositol-4,5-bisphosphate 3-kinase catalytic subunit beta n=1 Tax=Equus caballus TaxID=9796 RepID=A0A9L0SDY8_HORSE